MIEVLGKKVTATNEPRRVKCGAPDFLVTRKKRTLDEKLGYIECKDINTNLAQAAKTEQIKKRYLPSLHNFILTDYIEFRWYVGREIRLTARLADEGIGGKFQFINKGVDKVGELLGLFLSQEPERITTAKELAIRMGAMARFMRTVIAETFKQEEEVGPLHGQLEAFREVLIHDLTEEQFADMYAQTICYGLFTARCHIEEITIFGKDRYAIFHGMDARAKELTREHAAYLLPKTNPFFRDIFGDIAGPKLDDRVVWLVDDLVLLLRNADMGVILRDFARRKKRRDPVIHFYETFLGGYDPKLKKKRGIYYTPDEVVSYIVRSVDILLKEKFGLKRGLADDSKIKGTDLHKLLILDPAVGTGTFLFQVIEQIYKRFGRQKGMWSGYVKEHLLPRIFGFELMMAPYAVAHMKLGLQLAETGYDFGSDERLGIYLTNTLEEAEETSRTLFAQYLSQEARAANKVKRDLPIMVVMGNPPYAGISANQGEWINRLIGSYREVDGEPLGEKKVWVKNDYVKFIRFGQWRIEQTGQGVLAFITDHSYLDSPTFRGMRRNLMNTFNEIYLLNLHGNAKRKETAPDGGKDENVFDILQGTAISIFVRSSDEDSSRVFYTDLWGVRRAKYEFLAESSVQAIKWQQIEPKAPFYEFVPVDMGRKKEYEKAWKVTDIFRIGSNGVQTSRDRLVVRINEEELRQRFARIRDKSADDGELKRALRIEDRSFWKFS
ncbi:MAG TPA: N-6 DNA methylase, partial [Acidobacteriota bacterium]|nr:N-6 DNA methylase [Acidobacteriota bacterium]